MVVVFPAPLTPTTMITAGGSSTYASGRSFACRTSSRYSRIRPRSSPRIAHQLAIHALADAVQNFVRGGDADIGADQRVFEFFEQIGVDLLAAGDDVFDARDKPVARLLNAALEFFE